MENNTDAAFEKSVKDSAQFDSDVMEGISSYKPDQDVAMRQPRDNTLYMIRGSDVPNYLNRGYRSVTGEEIKAYDDAEKMGIIGKVAIAALDAADAIFLTVPKRIIKHVVNPQAGRVLNELETQSPYGDIGSIIGTVATLGTGLAAKPTNIALGASDHILGLLAKKGLAEGEQIAARAALEGAPSIASTLVKGIGGGLKKGVVNGLAHGAALGAPAASVEFAFGNNDEAGEILLMSAGIGAGMEGIVGGLVGGVKSFGDIAERIKGSTGKLIKKVYGIGEKESELVTSGKVDEYTQEINETSSKLFDENLNRRLKTLQDLGIEPETAPPEMVFEGQEKLAKALESEKIQLPFSERKPLEQRAIIQNKVEKKALEELNKLTKETDNFTESEVHEVVADKIFKRMSGEYEPLRQIYKNISNLIEQIQYIRQPLGKTKQMGLFEKLETETQFRNVPEQFGKLRRELVGQLHPERMEHKSVDPVREEIKRRIEETASGKDWNKLMDDFRAERTQYFKSIDPAINKIQIGKVYTKALDMMEGVSGRLLENLAGKNGYKLYKEANAGYKKFLDKYGEVYQMITGYKPKKIAGMLDVLDTESIREKIANNIFDPTKNFYKNKKLAELFPEEFKVAAAAKLRTTIRANTKNGVLNTRGLLDDIENWGGEMKEMVFGAKSRKVMSDLNHLLGGIKDLSPQASKMITGELVDAATGAGVLAGSILGGASGAAVLVGGVKVYKAAENIFSIMKLNSEKEAIIRASLSTEQNAVTSNAARAVKKINEAHESVKKWVDFLFDQKDFKISKIVIPALVVEERRKGDGILETYEKNLDTIKKATAHADYIKKEITDRTNSFSRIPSVHMNYLNKSSNALEALRELSKGQLPIKKKSFFKVPNVKPSKNQMLQFNNQMKAFKNPFKIVEDLSNGIINPDAIKIAETVYPSTVARIRKTFTDKLMNTEDLKISYQDRLKFGLFLGTDLDGSMQYTHIFNQSGQIAHNQELNQNNKQVKLSGNLRSPAQSIGVRT